MSVIGVLVVTSYLFLLTRVMVRTEYNIWFALILAPSMYLVTVPLLRRMLEKVEPDPWIRNAVVLALAAKFVGAFARFYTNELVLGHADASSYYDFGLALAEEFKAFIFGGPVFQQAVPDFTGTRFIRFISGIVYVFLGESQLAGYIVFSFMSFWGLYLFYRAFCIAVPDGLRRRYTVLVFFLPSMVFWPSSIGKEAWMITMLGTAAYGLARLLAQQRGAYPLLLVATAGLTLVRPHVAAIFGAGAGAAFVLRRSKGGAGTARKIIGLIVLAAVAGLVMNQLQSFFDLQDGLNPQQVFDETTRRSSQGGSQFESVQPTSPIQLPWAIITVLFRPFLFEASGLSGLVTALEGTVLLGLFVWNLPRLARLPAAVISRPYIGFSVVYTLVFVFGFSAISNFGILARQRTQLFPVAVIMLAVPYESLLRTRDGNPAKRGTHDRANETDGPSSQAGAGSGHQRQAREVVHARYLGRGPSAVPQMELLIEASPPEPTDAPDPHGADRVSETAEFRHQEGRTLTPNENSTASKLSEPAVGHPTSPDPYH